MTEPDAAEIVLAAPARTPLGRFGGALRDLPFTDLAAHAVRASLARARLDPEAVDHIVFTVTVPTDPDSLFAARAVGLAAGLPVAVPALLVSRACASGLQAILSAADQIRTGASRIAVAAGAESFSRAPHAVRGLRGAGLRGDHALEDMLDWAYRCPATGVLMGETAEALADAHGHTRAEMDALALASQRRAAAGAEARAAQIAPVETGAGALAADEGPRPEVTAEKLAALRPAFRHGGRVTAGNSSGVTDGAAAMIVAERGAAEQAGLAPVARLGPSVAVGVDPALMGHGPVPAVRALLERTGLAVADIDHWEINEAFAVVPLHAERELGLPRDRVNPAGGAIALGHPPAVTGLRMAMTAAQGLAATGGRRAVLALCLGGGQGMAMLIERP